MFNAFKRMWVNHCRDNLWLYFIVVVCLIIGVVMGSVSVKLLTVEETRELGSYLSSFIGELEGIGLDQLTVVRQSLYNNLKTIGLLWFLGLTVIGTPMILIILFTKGFTLGFTAGFLVQTRGWQGVLLAFTALTPANLLLLPGLVTAGVLGMTFSVWLVKGRHELRSTGIFQQFFAYTFSIAIISTVIVAAGFLEAYCSPFLMKLVVSYFKF